MWAVTAESPSGAPAPAATARPDAGSGALGSVAPGVAGTRYRCASCGNLTRFDVVTTRRTRAFHHFSVGGELSVEDAELLDESVEEVSCRWCGHGRGIEVIDGGAPPG